jgi:hypothetical protein
MDWSRLFRDYHAIVDSPGWFFYRELLKQYPRAQVVLTVRDPEQ